MTDLDERYRALSRTRGPDLWPDIVSREPRSEDDKASPRRRRALAVAIAVIVFGAGLGLLVRAFQPGPGRIGTPSAGPIGPSTTGAVPPEIKARLVEALPVVARGTGTAVLAVGGSVWVTAFSLETDLPQFVRRIDPSTGSIVATIPLEGIPAWEIGGGGMAFGDGSLWVTGERVAGSTPEPILQRIDLTTNEVVATIPLRGTRAADVAVNGAGVWVASYLDLPEGGWAELARIDPATDEIVARIPLASDLIRRVVAVTEAVVVEEWGTTVVEIIDPQRNQVAAASDSGAWHTSAVSILLSSDQVWATFDGGISPVDLSTAGPAGAAIGQGIHPRCICAGGRGGIWVEQAGGLSWLDTQTGHVSLALDLPDHLTDVRAAAANQNSVWLLSMSGELARVDME